MLYTSDKTALSLSCQMLTTMTKLLLLFSLVASCQLAFGAPLPLAGQKITYRRDIPKNVARSLPLKTKRLFWGTWLPEKGAPTMGIQFYESHNDVTIELWEKQQRGFVRINRWVNLYTWSPDAKFGADFYWLDNTKNTTPVLVLTRISYENLMPGEYRVFAVIPFVAGWKSKPTIQSFGDGNSNAGAEGFELQRDEKGTLELSIWSFGNSQISETDIYDWDEKQFSIVPEKHKTVYPTND